jgi:protein-tyrosine phosphatase
MKVDIYWIPEIYNGHLAIMPKPRAGEWLKDELNAWHTGGINMVVSLLTPTEAAKLGLQNEPEICRENQMEYISYPIRDRQVPISPSATIELVKKIRKVLKENQGVAIHCRMGVGRSALIAACVLVSEGIETKTAFEVIGKARGISVPDTEEQERWVEELSKDLQTS